MSESAVLLTILGLLLAGVAAAIAVLSFETLATNVAFGIAGVMTVAGAIAVAKRVPTAMWWTVGALCGAVLGHWS